MNRLWGLLARQDCLRYFARNSHLTLAGVVRTQEKLAGLIGQNPDFDWYVTLNPTRQNSPPKARSRDVTEWAWILLDIDPVAPDADPQRALDFVLDTHNLREYCAVLDSGRGRQAWLSLRPSTITDTDHDGRAKIEQATSIWLRSLDPFKFSCRIDTSCRDLARVARCPGTVNSKTGREARIISMPSEQLDPQEILRYAECIAGREPAHVEFQNLSQLLPHLTETAARFLTEGIISPGRHSACYATARSLAESGVPIDRAMGLVLQAAHVCRPQLPIRDAARAVRHAYEKGPDGRYT